jgi:dihydrofolate reductase
MRKVVLQMQVSLDMFVARTDHELDWVGERGFGPKVSAWMNAAFGTIDTMLLGRVAFEEQQGYWPTDQAKGEALTGMINAWEKVVFSKALAPADATWPNSRVVSSDLATEIARIKALKGGDILVSGGSTFAQAMSAQGLVDEYRLVVHPVALGAGLPLFGTQVDLELVSSEVLGDGVMGHVYVPAR